MANPRTTEQKRAERALARVQEAKNQGKKFRDDYKNFAKRAPANIQTNGLGQTLAFWRSKGKGDRGEAAEVIYRDISQWVLEEMKWSSDNDDLLKKVTECSTNEYRRATIEAMAFLNWLRRFAEAELGDGE
jgi:CRISPR-associated protein Cmr5